MTTATVTLTDFLLARIAEDEANPWRGAEMMGADRVVGPAEAAALVADEREWVARVLAECGAKRRIVARHAPEEFIDAPGEYSCRVTPNVGFWPCDDLRDLAAVYSDHPDYRAEWA